MTKNEAINIVNAYLEVLSLNNSNTHFSNINSSKEVWWLHIPPEKFQNNLHLLLFKTDGFVWLEITANTFRHPEEVFKLRDDTDKIDLEISSNVNERYMCDVKAGGTGYDFNQYIAHEF